MVIAKMNSVLLKHSRILFGIITGVIIISFVWFFTPGADGSILFGKNPLSPNAVVGKVFDDNVTRGQLLDAVRDITLFQAVNYNMKPDMSLFGESARQSAFEVAARMIVAKRLGIQVPLTKVGEYLRALPAFRKDGKFDPALYEAYEKNSLHPYGYNALDLDNAVRCFLTMNELGNLAADDIIVTKNEIRNFERTMLEKYEVKTVLFPFEAARRTLKPTEAELKNYHKANPKDFMTLPNYKVKLVRFVFNSYLPKVKLAPDAVKKYYDANKAEFTKNGKLQPMNAVVKQIENKLKTAEAEKLAMRDARAFRETLYEVTAELETPAYLGAFESAAGKKGYPVLTSAWFNRENKDLDQALVSEVASLQDRSPITKTVRGKDTAFIAILVDHQAARPSTYAESAAKVREMYLTSKSIVLAQENARNFRAEMSKSKNPAASLAASAKGAVVKSVPLFSLDAQPKENAQQIVQLATQTMNGQLSQQVSTPEGIFMVFVAKRIQPDAKELDKEEARFTTMYKRGKSYAVTDSFSTWIGRNIVNYTQGKD